MVVNLTPNLGLAKPTESELAANWARLTDLQGDNNLILSTEMNEIITVYGPTFKAQTSDPNLGTTGQPQGEYQEIAGIVMGNFIVTISGTGMTTGSGEYGISLPFLADSTYHSVGNAFNATPGAFSVIGEGFIFDASTATTSGSLALDLVNIGGVSYARFLTEAHTTPAKTSRLMRDSMPIVFADADRIIGNFMYKKA